MNPDNARRLVEFGTTTVATAAEMLGFRDPTVGYTGPDTRAIMPDFGARVGVAVTARFDTTTAGADNPESLFLEWLYSIREAARSYGDEPMPVFAVLEAVGPRPRHTVIGPMLATQIALAGGVGLITNGCVRDLEKLRKVPMPCWAAGLAPMHGRMRWLDVGRPVVIDGMTVRAGDFVHADANGAVAFPADTLDAVYEKSVAVRERDRLAYARWAAPRALEAILAARGGIVGE